MVRRHPAAAALIVALLLLVLAPGALAAGPPGRQGSNNGNHGQGRGKDPCTKPHVPDYCQQAPEAPAGLLYPAAAGVALTLFVCCERRRRRHALPGS